MAAVVMVMVALHPCETVELVTLADFASIPECGDVGQVQVGREGAEHWVCFRHAAVFGVQVVCAQCGIPVRPNPASPSGWAHDQHSNHVAEPAVGTQQALADDPEPTGCAIEAWK